MDSEERWWTKTTGVWDALLQTDSSSDHRTSEDIWITVQQKETIVDTIWNRKLQLFTSHKETTTHLQTTFTYSDTDMPNNLNIPWRWDNNGVSSRHLSTSTKYKYIRISWTECKCRLRSTRCLTNSNSTKASITYKHIISQSVS